MAEFLINGMDTGYAFILDGVQQGDRVSPRGLPTRELLDVSIKLTDPTRALPVGTGRSLNTKIAAVEALQLIGGVCHPEVMTHVSAEFRKFMDGGTFHGGYGQRTRAQIPAAIKRLQEDRDTRQAVVTMWDPLHDLFTPGMKDYPCTISLQFLVRDNRLQLHTHMRSNDVWRGLAYDVFVFTQLQQVVAAAMLMDVGSYFHHTTSLHMYETDYEASLGVVSSRERHHVGCLVERAPRAFHDAAHLARQLLNGFVAPAHHLERKTVAWYWERMK